MTTQPIVQHILDNGLTVYFVHDPLSALVSVKTYVRAGSINEAPHLGCGLSHYLEHLVAGGATLQRSESDYKALIAQLGGSFNAYTTLDHTCYFLNTLPDYIEDAVQILYEWMFYNSFGEKEFLRERDVIIKEIEKNDASITRKFFHMSQELFYQYHPAKYPVIGYLENFKKVTIENLKAYYYDRYIASNMALVIGGNLTQMDELLEKVNQTFGKEPYKSAPTSSKWEEPVSFNAKWVEKEGETQVSYLSIRFPGCDTFSNDLYPLDLLDFILGNGENSILYRTLVEEKQLVYNVYTSSYTPSFGGGYFDVVLELDYEKKDEAYAEVLNCLNFITSKKITKKEVEQAQKQKLAEHILSITTLEDKVEQIGLGFIYVRSPFYYDDYTKKFREVTLDQVVDCAKRYLDPEHASITVLKPKTEKKVVEKTQHAPTSPWLLPEKKTLKNGTRVLLCPTKSNPQKVVIKAFMLGGVRAETSANNGIGALLSELMGKESKQFTKKQILDAIEGNGAELDGNVGNHTLSLNFECLTEDLNQLLPIFIDCLLHPEFKKSEMDLARRDQLKRIRQRKDDWYTASSLEFKRLFFQTHPYGFALNGEVDSVESLTIQNLYDFYTMMLNPEQLVVTVIGDFEADPVFNTLEKALSGLAVPAQPFSSLTHLERPMHLSSVQWKKTVLQDVAALYVGFDALSFKQKSMQPQFDLLHTVLSGAQYPTGRLHYHLREKGLVYMVHGTYNIGYEPHSMTLCALTSSDKLEEVKTIVLDQIADLQHSDVGHDEFNQALAQLRFYSRDRVSSLDSLAVISATDELYGFGYDHYTQKEALLLGLSPQDIRHTANEFLQNPQICMFEKG